LDTTSSSSVFTTYYTKYINITAPTITDNNSEKGVAFFGA